MKDETVKFVVAKLLPGTWKRESTKQVLDRIHDRTFEENYLAMLKGKNLTDTRSVKPTVSKSLVPKKLFDFVKVKIKLPLEKPVVIQ